MRSQLIAAAFAATAFAKPLYHGHQHLHEKRQDYVYQTSVVYEEPCTETESPYQPQATYAAYSSPASPQQQYTPAPQEYTPVYTPAPQVYTVYETVGAAPQPQYTVPAYSSPASPASPAYTPSSGGSGGSGPTGSYQEVVLAQHNVHRKNHSACELTWSDELASYAQQVAETCVWGHNLSPGGGNYGQNIAAGVAPSQAWQVVTMMWYEESQLYGPSYGQPNPLDFEACGHFTAMVWKGTNTVGCFTSDCTAQGGVSGAGGDVEPYFTVCNYGPPGNWGGEYAQNVGEPIGMPACTSEGCSN